MFHALIAQPLGRLFGRSAQDAERDTAPPSRPSQHATDGDALATTIPGHLTTLGGGLPSRRAAPPQLDASGFALTQPGDMPRVADRAGGRTSERGVEHRLRRTDSAARRQDAAARRPLVAANGTLAGFEFCVDSPLRSRLRYDTGSARDCALAVLRTMRPTADAGQVALAELPASWLALCLGDGLLAKGMHLVLGTDAMFDDPYTLAALTAKLREAGVLVGWRPPGVAGEPVPPGKPDFLPLTAPVRNQADSWRQAMADATRRWPDVPMVLLDLASVELLESTLVPPAAMAACSVGLCDEPARPEEMPPAAGRLLHLLGLVGRDRGGQRLSALMKSDPALHHLLLQGLNQPGIAPGRGFLSVEQAFSVLGKGSAHRHIARWLVQQAPARPATATLRQHALARARLTELLAITAGESDTVALYLTGLASMLPMLMRCSADDALAPLLLPPDAITALAEQTGPWMRYVTLIRAIERHDMVAAEALALPFGGLQAVLSLANDAWRAPV